MKKALQSAEVKIKEITARIDAKTLEIRAVFPEYGADLSVRETRRARRNAVKVSKLSYAPELVALWKGDAETLFTQFRGSDGTVLAGLELEQALTAEKINALITGSIRIQDEYAAVQAELRRYPGGTLVASALEIGRLDSVDTLARRMAYDFVPAIENSIPARISFAFPDGAPANFRIAVDDMVFSTLPTDLPVPAGSHQVTVEAPSFQTEHITANFDGGTNYQIDLSLTEAQLRSVSLALQNQTPGLFMLQGISTNVPAPSVSLGEGKTLGRFDPEDPEKVPGFFVIPRTAATSPVKNWVVNPNTVNVSALIEKRRREMYLTYSLFMCALPVAVIAQGEYTKSVQSYNNRVDTDLSKPMTWQTTSYIAVGASIALGAAWIWQLIRYLRTAGGVVPAQAKPSSTPLVYSAAPEAPPAALIEAEAAVTAGEAMTEEAP
jgi:hypothetical protein